MNRLAVEANNHVSWEYDRELWAKVTDRIRGYDEVSAKAEIVKVCEQMKSRMHKQFADDYAKSKAEKDRANAEAARKADAKGGGKGSRPTPQFPHQLCQQ